MDALGGAFLARVRDVAGRDDRAGVYAAAPAARAGASAGRDDARAAPKAVTAGAGRGRSTSRQSRDADRAGDRAGHVAAVQRWVHRGEQGVATEAGAGDGAPDGAAARAPGPVHGGDVAQHLRAAGEIGAPTMVVSGTADRIVPHPNSVLIARGDRRARVWSSTRARGTGSWWSARRR